MAATSSNLLITKTDGNLRPGLAAAEALYQGQITFINASGYHTSTKSTVLGGILREAVDNSGGSAGDKEVEVYRGVCVELNASGLDQASVGATAYAQDNNLIVDADGGGDCPVGEIVEVISATRALVAVKF